MISVLGQLKGGNDMFDSFEKSFLKNADKCCLIAISKPPGKIEVPNITVISGEKVKLLGIYIDNRQSFDYQIGQLI